MSFHLPRHFPPRRLGVIASAVLVAACGGPSTPSEPIATDHVTHPPGMLATGNSEDKGYITGWYEGEDVSLYYTKAFSCSEPPASQATTDCEIGAPGEAPPRPGNISYIYAIAAVGIQPDPATLSCRAGTPCLNHPGMIDASRVGGSPQAGAPSHSHILDARGGGWRQTINIRVFSLAAWNEIAAAKTLAKVRELQGGNPAVGVPGVISADTPTNIYFFIASWR